MQFSSFRLSSDMGVARKMIGFSTPGFHNIAHGCLKGGIGG